MAQPFLGQVILVPYNFAPRGYLLCNGQLLPISQFDALFTLLGTTYGGDGNLTFGLPDLRGRLPLHQGSGPGLSPYTIGQTAGSETVTLLTTQIPAHAHVLGATTKSGTSPVPTGLLPAEGGAYDATSDGTTMLPLANAGGSQPHDNVAPLLTMNYCIATAGIYPSQS